jgi:PAS domain S-box-containing protein
MIAENNTESNISPINNNTIDHKKKIGEIKELLTTFYEFIPVGIMIVNDENIIKNVNENTCRISGYKKNELIGQHCDKILMKASIQEEYPAGIEPSNESGEKETVIKCSDGQIKPILVNSKQIWYGIQSFVIEILQDIGQFKKAEKALAESENMYRSLLEALPEGIVILDLTGHIVEVSGITLEIFASKNEHELIGKHFLQFIHQQSRKKIRNVIEKTLSEGLEQDVEFILLKTNGKQFVGEISTTLIQEADGKPKFFMAIIRDITQRKEFEKQLIHTDRLVSLGEMATGIAHEINQPLNTISMTLDNMLMEISRNKKQQTDYLKTKIDKIFDNIGRISKIIDHIRAFSRNSDDYIPVTFDINESIRNALSMISLQIKHQGIDLITDLADNLPLVYGNTFKFEQVILNMVINAKDALEKKECDKKIRIRTFKTHSYIYTEISDNGIGIKQEDIENVMLPFYTTKEAGKGTGMGLAISYGIIKEMKGEINIQSEEGKGTIVRISLPFIDQV